MFGDKRPEKPIIDKMSSFDKGLTEGGKLTEGWGGFGGAPESGAGTAQLEARVAVLEAALRQLTGSGGAGAAQPFIGSALRPDLSEGALMGEEDYEHLGREMQQGSVKAKRLYDSKGGEV